jgi:hypothetical protein
MNAFMLRKAPACTLVYGTVTFAHIGVSYIQPVSVYQFKNFIRHHVINIRQNGDSA